MTMLYINIEIIPKRDLSLKLMLLIQTSWGKKAFFKYIWCFPSFNSLGKKGFQPFWTAIIYFNFQMNHKSTNSVELPEWAKWSMDIEACMFEAKGFSGWNPCQSGSSGKKLKFLKSPGFYPPIFIYPYNLWPLMHNLSILCTKSVSVAAWNSLPTSPCLSSVCRLVTKLS